LHKIKSKINNFSDDDIADLAVLPLSYKLKRVICSKSGIYIIIASTATLALLALWIFRIIQTEKLTQAINNAN
jgi:hypothetical protein